MFDRIRNTPLFYITTIFYRFSGWHSTFIALQNIGQVGLFTLRRFITFTWINCNRHFLVKFIYCTSFKWIISFDCYNLIAINWLYEDHNVQSPSFIVVLHATPTPHLLPIKIIILLEINTGKILGKWNLGLI